MELIILGLVNGHKHLLQLDQLHIMFQVQNQDKQEDGLDTQQILGIIYAYIQ